MTKQEKLDALIKDLRSVAKSHDMLLDKYAEIRGPTKYFFKLQFDDVSVDIEDVFTPISHRLPAAPRPI